MSEITPLPSGGTVIITGLRTRPPISEITPLPPGGTVIITGPWKTTSTGWHVGTHWGSSTGWSGPH